MHKHIFFLFFLLGPADLAGSLAQTSDPAGRKNLTRAQHSTRVIKITNVQCQANYICMHSLVN